MTARDLQGLDYFISEMQKSLKTYQILHEEEETRLQMKGTPTVQPGFYLGCVNVLQSLLYLSSDIQRRNHQRIAEGIQKKE